MESAILRLPHFMSEDNAIWRRIRIVEFPPKKEVTSTDDEGQDELTKIMREHWNREKKGNPLLWSRL